MQKELEEKYAAYEKGAAQMSDVIRKERETELQGLQGRIQEFGKTAEQSLQTKYQQLVNPVVQKIQKAIDAVAKETGYRYVFNLDAGANTIPILLVGPEEDNITNFSAEKIGYRPAQRECTLNCVTSLISNYVNLMISTKFGHQLSDALRDLKKFTSRKIIAAISDKEQPENRQRTRFPAGYYGYSNRLDGPALGEANSKHKDYPFLQQENHPIELISNKFIDQKLGRAPSRYIHMNPVKAGLVD